MKTKKLLVFISLFLTISLSMSLVYQWYSEANAVEEVEGRLKSLEDVDTFIGNFEKKNNIKLVRIPTGMFLQSVFFTDAYTVNFTGYLWQKYTEDFPKEVRKGFVFPEKVSTAGSYTEEEAYTYINDDGSVVKGFYFESYLRQDFDYSEFPFDQKTLWIRIWPKNFLEDVIITPDLSSYSTRDLNGKILGLDDYLVLEGYDVVDSFFNYKNSIYNTNFGVSRIKMNSAFPDLFYNIVFKRKVENAIIIYLTPLFLVLLLLFGGLLTITGRKNRISEMDFSVTALLGACSALFFVVVLSHVELRSRFVGSPIIYIEYFYIVTYIAIFLVSLLGYLFCDLDKTKTLGKILHYKDNFLAKICYWPFLLGVFNLITFVVLS